MMPDANMAAQPAQSAKPLRALLHGLAEVAPRHDRAIAGLSLDSRSVARGHLFIAVPGATHDGRDYIPLAVQRGAAAVVREKMRAPPARDCSVPSFDIAGLNAHIGGIAARFFDHPSARMQSVGITGTNGKTTCAWLIAQALDLLGRRCALMTTLGAGFVGALHPSPLTTADALATQRTLASLLARRAAAVCIEVSSHGLEQGRVNGVAFDIAVLTNLSRDHLDYHRSMAHYRDAKRKLFKFDALGCAVINIDDRFGRDLLHRHRAARCLTYGVHNAAADLRARGFDASADGIALRAEYRGETAVVRSPLLGAVNVPNLLAAIAAVLCCGHGLREIAATAGQWRAPPGRMELIPRQPHRPAVVIDYAHTPDALERALASLAPLCRGRLWVVFGCGGDRDPGKRPLMGRVAEAIADRVLITDDNPRFESPEHIAAQITEGMTGKAEVIHDRRRAILTALTAAAAEDMVLVAGKGHEATQTVGDRVLELSDRDIVAEAPAVPGGPQ